MTPPSGHVLRTRPGLGGRGGRQRQRQSLRELVRRREEEGEEGGWGGEGGPTTSGGIREAEEERIRLAVLERRMGAAFPAITSSGMLDGDATTLIAVAKMSRDGHNFIDGRIFGGDGQ